MPDFPKTGSGLGVDIHGGPVIDPTKNVLDLVTASIKRIDDVTALQQQLTAEKINRAEEMTKLRAEHNNYIAELRAEHQKAIDDQESKRLDAVRTIDQIAVQREAERASAGIATLAASAASTADVLRNAVNTSAQTLATQLDRMMSATTERISSLEKTSYTGQGKQAVADPQIERLSALVENLVVSNSQRTGKSEGMSTLTGVIVIIAGMLISIGTFLGFSNKPSAPASAQPQIIYIPAPSGTMIPSPPAPQK